MGELVKSSLNRPAIISKAGKEESGLLKCQRTTPLNPRSAGPSNRRRVFGELLVDITVNLQQKRSIHPWFHEYNRISLER